jgi:hypothetical protein
MPLPFLMGVFPAAAAAAAAPSGAAITLSGSLSATGSSSTVTSAAITVTVPAGNSGVIRFEGITALGSGAELRGRINSAPYNPIAIDGTELTFANSDTITLAIINALSAGDGIQVSLYDATNGSLIATYGTPQLYRV